MLCHFMRTTGRTKPLIWMALATAFACFSWTASSDSAWGQSHLPGATAIGRAVNVSLLRVGLGGLGRVGCWIPIRLEAGGLLAGSEIRVVVVASDARGDQCADNVVTTTADSSGNIAIASVFMTGRLDGMIIVRLLDSGDNVLWEYSLPCRSIDKFPVQGSSVEAGPVPSWLTLMTYRQITVATIGVPDALNLLANELASGNATKDTLAVMSVESIDDLPTSRRGLDSVDYLLLVDRYELSKFQRLAVEEWVTAGGHLIVSCGVNLPELLQSTVGDWLQPIFEIEPTPVFSQDLSALQNFVSGSSQLQTNRKPVAIMKLRSNQAWSVVDSINGPLIQRVSYGAGMITMVAVDLNEKPVSQWISLPQLYEMLIVGWHLDVAENRVSRSGRISSSGVSDLATQLAAVSDAVPPADRWSTWSVMLLIVLFLLVIGPIDYLLVVRVLRKPHLTWLTFPILIAATCALAVSWVGTREAALVVRQVHLLDVAQPKFKQTIRVRSWDSLSAADSGYISVTAKPLPIATSVDQQAIDDSRTTVSWHGRAEDVYGGLYREGGVALGRQLSHRSDRINGQDSGFSSVPTLTDGSSAFLAETLMDVSASLVVESHLRVPPSGLLEGEFTHHLSTPIRNWAVVFGNRVYRPSPKANANAHVIEPGKPWSRENNSVAVSDLREFLKGLRMPEPSAQKKTSTSPNHIQSKSFYNTQGTNPLDILTMVSLYDVPGGETFVKLQNNALRHDDVSDVIHLNTVLVLGTLDVPLSEMIVNGTTVIPTESQTVVRLLLPVRRVGSVADSRMAEPLASVPLN